ncbi:trypsin-like serine peptidase [Sulfitobacter sabulilitoris]|uniref:Trypsin-like serine protease n=1 Tax=Sulfitobacter sabulilitoris TaxID=2562655 RepID=A0A5S3PFI5_9RHOB|nr:trypsin-like serine protease [Sulfitobacter sabulilitoris]TMM52759.1 trypsin-like serine protease [Sulfitobacter sabulilitoris]
MFLGALVISLIAAGVAMAQSNTGLKGLRGANDALAWQAVGRLDAGGIGFCTATLIDPDTVLTAAHCVYDPGAGTLLNAQDLTFRAGLRAQTVAAERKILQIAVHDGYRPDRGLTMENIRHDVALLRLARPIPTSQLDPFVLHGGAVSPGPVSVVSYGRGRETLPSRQKVCQMLEIRGDVLAMDCDVTFGSSGAPVFSHLNGRGRIISLVSGIGRMGGKQVMFGMALPRVVADLKRQLRAAGTGPVARQRRIAVGARTTAGGAKFIRP